MVALDDKTGGVQFGKFDKGKDLSMAIRKYIKVDLDDLFIICIGTDRSTGDSLAPLVGSMLTEKGYKNVIGTIDDPVHAVNLDDKLKLIPEGKTVLAIDAALGKLHNVGKLHFNKGSLSPGAGVGKELTNVGDFNIQGTVNVSGHMEFLVIQTTRLSLVMRMAKDIAFAIENAFTLPNTNKVYRLPNRYNKGFKAVYSMK